MVGQVCAKRYFETCMSLCSHAWQRSNKSIFLPALGPQGEMRQKQRAPVWSVAWAHVCVCVWIWEYLTFISSGHQGNPTPFYHQGSWVSFMLLLKQTLNIIITETWMDKFSSLEMSSRTWEMYVYAKKCERIIKKNEFAGEKLTECWFTNCLIMQINDYATPDISRCDCSAGAACLMSLPHSGINNLQQLRAFMRFIFLLGWSHYISKPKSEFGPSSWNLI